jgi:hypothetical protein
MAELVQDQPVPLVVGKHRTRRFRSRQLGPKAGILDLGSGQLRRRAEMRLDLFVQREDACGAVRRGQLVIDGISIVDRHRAFTSFLGSCRMQRVPRSALVNRRIARNLADV